MYICKEISKFDSSYSIYYIHYEYIDSTRFSEINPFDGQLRLEKGEYSSEGRVEVYCNAEWGTICDDAFSQVEADTICTQLGYTSASDFNHLIKL